METIRVKDKVFTIRKDIVRMIDKMEENEKYEYLSDLANKQAKSIIPLGILMEATINEVNNGI